MNMAESEQETQLYGAVAMYGPYKVQDVKACETKYWCRCGLSKKQPWCDGSHKGTGIKPLPWKPEKDQALHYLCACKQTRSPPICDGHHIHAPAEVATRQENCASRGGHVTDCKLCTGCGWVPDF